MIYFATAVSGWLFSALVFFVLDSEYKKLLKLTKECIEMLEHVNELNIKEILENGKVVEELSTLLKKNKEDEILIEDLKVQLGKNQEIVRQMKSLPEDYQAQIEELKSQAIKDVQSAYDSGRETAKNEYESRLMSAKNNEINAVYHAKEELIRKVDGQVNAIQTSINLLKELKP